MNRICFIIIVFVCVGLSSCGANKRILTTREAESHGIAMQLDSSALRHTIDMIVNERMSKDIMVLSDRNITVDYETYSEPDSSGRQHVVEKLHVEFNSETSTVSENVAESAVEVSETTDSTAVSDISASAHMCETHSMDASKEPSKWQCMTWVTLAAVIAVLIAIIRIMKRWK